MKDKGEVCRGSGEEAQRRREILFRTEGLDASLVNEVLGIIGKTERLASLNAPGDGFFESVDFFITCGEQFDECRVGVSIWPDGAGNHVIVGLQNLRWLFIIPAKGNELVKDVIPITDSRLIVRLS
jgi:hypothetical protein